MPALNGEWRPAAMSRTENSDPSPVGFETFSYAGIGMSCKLIEPSSLEDLSNWEELVSGLKGWGDLPENEKVETVSISDDERGPIAVLGGESNWIAEFLPWGSDGKIRKRAKTCEGSCHVPCGGYTWNGADMIIMWREGHTGGGANVDLGESLESGDQGSAIEILTDCGEILGRYHSKVESSRITPPDPKRWNERIAGIEETLRSHSVWRVPHSRDSECVLTIGDVRFQDFIGGAIRIGRPRLSDSLFPPDCEFPAIRDLASLVHDLSRLYHETGSELDVVALRSAVIEGWKRTAPEKWCSSNVFYSHRGGLAIWEYEQCLLDVIEAVSHQSGAPQPATTLIGYVPSYQKRMFNNRTFGALSIMAGFFGVTSLINTFPPTIEEIQTPIASIIVSALLLRYYRGLSPPPEVPFTRSV